MKGEMVRLLWLFGLVLLVVGCRSAETPPLAEVTPEPPATHTVRPMPTETAVATPTLTPTTNELIICQAAEPESLYLYSQNSLAQTHLHHAIYESLYTQRSYSYQAAGLTKLPSLTDGDARLESFTVYAGDIVVDVNNIVIPLDQGVTVLDANGQPITYEGAPIDMVQMVVEFELAPMVWSDGRPVTAADSVYSFTVARAPASVLSAEQRLRLGRTAVYEATGERSLRWVGLPGWRDSHYFRNVWPPLPAHRLDIFTPSQLSQIDESVRRPLATGPYMVQEWVAGSHIRLTPNPHYYAATPRQIDGLLIRFVANPNQAVADLLAGDCHILTHDSVNPTQIPFFQEAAAAGLLLPHYRLSPDYMLLAFGVQPFGGEEAENGLGWFADERVRQAVALCINRERLVAELWGGRTAVMPTYLHPAHPLLPDDLPQWTYDPSAANALLDEAGYRDNNGDGLRQNEAGEPFAIQLFSPEAELSGLAGNLIRDSLAACGLAVTRRFLTDAELADTSPASPLAGRRFDLALLTQTTGIEPPCAQWQTDAITGPASAGFGGWAASNITGWSDLAFDAACEAARQAFWNSEAYQQQQQTALRRFGEGVPALPLYSNLHVALTRPQVVGFRPDPTQPSELWNVAAFDLR